MTVGLISPSLVATFFLKKILMEHVNAKVKGFTAPPPPKHLFFGGDHISLSWNNMTTVSP